MDSGRIFQGRPFGGCAILWSSNSKCVVTPIETHNSRVCAVTLKISDKKFLLVNVYMPTDTIHDIDNRIEYDNVLSSLSAIAIDCAPDAVMFGGDFNTDFSRSESLHTISLINFLPDESLFEPANEIDYSFDSMATDDRSFIDHFFLSSNLDNSVLSYGVSHDGSNLSDHSPIFVKLNIEIEQLSPKNCDQNVAKLCFMAKSQC